MQATVIADFSMNSRKIWRICAFAEFAHPMTPHPEPICSNGVKLTMTALIIWMIAAAWLVPLPTVEPGVDWGPAVDGLRMSAAIVPNEFGYRELVMTLQNTGFDVIWLPLSAMRFGESDSIHVIVTRPDGFRAGAFDPQSSAPRNESWEIPVPLLPKGSYAVRTLLGGWGFHAPELRRVEELLSENASLHLELRVGLIDPKRYRIDCLPVPPPPRPGSQTQKVPADQQTFWRGMLVSNTLRFPLINALPTSAGKAKKSAR